MEFIITAQCSEMTAADADNLHFVSGFHRAKAHIAVTHLPLSSKQSASCVSTLFKGDEWRHSDWFNPCYAQNTPMINKKDGDWILLINFQPLIVSKLLCLHQSQGKQRLEAGNYSQPRSGTWAGLQNPWTKSWIMGVTIVSVQSITPCTMTGTKTKNTIKQS